MEYRGYSILLLLRVQPFIAEIDQNAAGDHKGVENVEKENVPLYRYIPRLRWIGSNKSQFAYDGTDVTDPDKAVKEDTCSLCYRA